MRNVPDYPEILVISNVVENGMEIGSLGNAEAAWHTDMSYLETPPPGSLLYALEVPEAGGDTGFLNMYSALDHLPGDLRARIEGLAIKHDATTNSAGYLRAGTAPATDVRSSPGTCHPIIRHHGETGRPALYLGRRHLAYIPGLDLAESEALLDALWSHATQERFTGTTSGARATSSFGTTARQCTGAMPFRPRRAASCTAPRSRARRRRRPAKGAIQSGRTGLP